MNKDQFRWIVLIALFCASCHQTERKYYKITDCIIDDVIITDENKVIVENVCKNGTLRVDK